MAQAEVTPVDSERKLSVHAATVVAEDAVYEEFKYYCKQVLHRPVKVIPNEMMQERLNQWKKSQGMDVLDSPLKSVGIEEVKAAFFNVDKQWRTARKDIKHIDLLAKIFVELGGDSKRFSNTKVSLDKMFEKTHTNTILTVGEKCEACGLVVEAGHFDSDMFRFEDYIVLREKHQRLKEKLYELRVDVSNNQ